MENVRTVGSGVVHSSSRGAHSITWTGEIVLGPGVRCTGFATDTLQVSVRPPPVPLPSLAFFFVIINVGH